LNKVLVIFQRKMCL